MKNSQSKLIIIRGNSASGKSTVAKKVREYSNRKIAYVEQDTIRRVILKEKEVKNGDNIALIKQIVEFSLGRGYDVILEGILNFHHYGEMLQSLAENQKTYTFYFDIPLEETIQRHATKPIANEIDRTMLESWFTANDITGFKDEVIISENYTISEAVHLIVSTAGL